MMTRERRTGEIKTTPCVEAVKDSKDEASTTKTEVDQEDKIAT